MSSLPDMSKPAEPHFAADASVIEQRAGIGKLLSRLYRDVGLAAVAAELQVPARSLTPELAQAVERGAALLKGRLGDLAA